MVITIGTALGAGAQDAVQKGVRLSANAAIGGAGWFGSTVKHLKGKFAYRLGLGLDFPANRTWGFRTGLNFEGIGERMGEWDDYSYTSYDSSVSSLYLEVPLMATARIDAKKFDMVFNFGPYVGIGVGGKVTVDEGNSFSASEGLYSEGSPFRRFDMGLGFGLSFEVKRFIFSVDNRIGFLSIAENKKLYNYATFFGAGYKF